MCDHLPATEQRSVPRQFAPFPITIATSGELLLVESAWVTLETLSAEVDRPLPAPGTAALCYIWPPGATEPVRLSGRIDALRDTASRTLLLHFDAAESHKTAGLCEALSALADREVVRRAVRAA